MKRCIGLEGGVQKEKKTLRELFFKHEGKVSDKWTLYVAEYERIFRELRDKPVKLLEIGVQNGGSLEIWAKYFDKGIVFLGCDLDSACSALSFEDPRIALVIGDANDDSTREKILSYSPEFDIVIDDGSHHSKDIIRSFSMYFPKLADGGLYIVEDLHTSYWREFEGGLFNPYSPVSFFKRLVDIINFEHWGIERRASELLKGFQELYGFTISDEILQHIHSIEFYNSLCVVRKSRPINNKLGPRVVVGKNARVCPEIVDLHDTFLVPPPQTTNPWSTRARPPDEEVIELEQEIMELHNELAGIKNSTAFALVQVLWRIRLRLAPHGSLRERLLQPGLRALRVWSQEGFSTLVRKACQKI